MESKDKPSTGREKSCGRATQLRLRSLAGAHRAAPRRGSTGGRGPKVSLAFRKLEPNSKYQMSC